MKAKLLTPQRVICRISSLSFEEFQSIYAQLCANNFKYKGSLLEPIVENHSPEFHKRLSQKAKLEAKDIDSLKRYAARAAGRSTPFGLFAGGVLAQITQRDHIHLKERGAWLAHTRDFNLNTQVFLSGRWSAFSSFGLRTSWINVK